MEVVGHLDRELVDVVGGDDGGVDLAELGAVDVVGLGLAAVGGVAVVVGPIVDAALPVGAGRAGAAAGLVREVDAAVLVGGAALGVGRLPGDGRMATTAGAATAPTDAGAPMPTATPPPAGLEPPICSTVPSGPPARAAAVGRLSGRGSSIGSRIRRSGSGASGGSRSTRPRAARHSRTSRSPSP